MKRDKISHRRNVSSSSHHSVFLNRTANILGVHESEIKNILINHTFKSFRINSLKYNGPHNELITKIENLGVQIWPLKWLSSAFIFNSEDTAIIQASEYAQKGYIFIQNPSSYLPCLLYTSDAADE